MITFFTTPKTFTGQYKTNQINALRSWKNLSPQCEIIVFDQLKGADELVNELGIINITDVEKFSTELPLPLINDMFHKANTLSGNPICCYLNADIILPSDFLKKVVRIHEKLLSNYLLVGQRYDVNVNTELYFTIGWEKEFRRNYKNSMILHPPLGSDFFIFPKNQYEKNDIPPLVIGRPGWDNWFIYNGVKVKNIKVVDISNTTKVYHQNHKEEYNPGKLKDKATINNLSFLPEEETYNYVLDRTDYYITYRKVKKRTPPGFFKKAFIYFLKTIGLNKSV